MPQLQKTKNTFKTNQVLTNFHIIGFSFTPKFEKLRIESNTVFYLNFDISIVTIYYIIVHLSTHIHALIMITNTCTDDIQNFLNASDNDISNLQSLFSQCHISVFRNQGGIIGLGLSIQMIISAFWLFLLMLSCIAYNQIFDISIVLFAWSITMSRGRVESNQP